MGSDGPTARRCLRKSGSELSEHAGCGGPQQYLAFHPAEEQYKISLDQRANDGDFWNKARFAGYAPVYAEERNLQLEDYDCDGHPLQPRRAGSGAAAERPTA